MAILLAQVGDRVLEEHWVQPHVGAQQRHVAKHRGKCIETSLPLYEVVRIVPRGPAILLVITKRTAYKTLASLVNVYFMQVYEGSPLNKERKKNVREGGRSYNIPNRCNRSQI